MGRPSASPASKSQTSHRTLDPKRFFSIRGIYGAAMTFG
jgi:hypothetical protein